MVQRIAQPFEQSPRSSRVEIRNVGPIERLDIPIPENGGVVVLRGNNGTGKSTGAACVEAIQTGDTAKLSLRDGELKGSVEGLGVKINVGRSRNTRSGQLETLGLDHPIDLATFISPKRQDEKAADKDRIRELVALSGMKTDTSLFWELFGGKAEFEDVIDRGETHGRDMIEVSGIVKRTLQRQANEAEKHALELKGKVNALRTANAELDLNAESDADKLQADLEAATAHASKLEAESKSARLAQHRFNEAKTKIDSFEDIRSSSIEVEYQNAVMASVELSTQLSELNHQLVEVKAKIEANNQRRDDLKRRHEEAEKQEANRRELLATIKAGCQDGPSVNEIEEARVKLEAARKAVRDGVLIRDAIQKRRQAEQVEARMKSLEKEAEAKRTNAAQVDAIVSAAIKAPGLMIEDGRLIVTTRRGKTYFHDLSDGERTRIALELGVQRVGEHGLLVLQQHFWEGLDGNTRAQVNAEAKRLGVVVITAEASDLIGENPISSVVLL